MIGDKKRQVVLAGAIGNALEWYDFTIYAFFVPLIATQFFPSHDPFISLLATFAVFAIGFLARPLGAILYGYIGDHIGRKKALITSMIMISCPTLFIGILPNYEQIGIFAPIGLVILRIIQGLAVSGELTTATVFLIEHADYNKRGVAGSLAMAGAYLGMVISSIFATVTSSILTNNQLDAWGWRIPFIFGGLLGIMGLILRLKSTDPHMYLEEQKTNYKTSHAASIVKHINSLNYQKLIIGILLTCIMAISNYFLIAYFNTFLTQTMKMPLKPVMFINTIGLSVQLFSTILMGKLSDYVGRKKVLGFGILSIIVLSYPVFWLFMQHNIYLALLGEVMFAIAAGAISGLIPTTLAEMFDTYHRNMGISVSYNISLALFGGTAPLVAISLIATTHNLFAPAEYLIICSCIAFIALLTIKESYKKTLYGSEQSSQIDIGMKSELNS